VHVDKADIVVQIVGAFNRAHQDVIRYVRHKHFSISSQQVCVHIHNKLHSSSSVQFVDSRTEVLYFNTMFPVH